MDKKIAISIIITFIVVVIGFELWNFALRNNSVTENNNNSYNIENDANNVVNISSKYITDDCLNEWIDYSKTISENQDIESASNDMINETTRYLVKDIDGYISIYYLDDFNEEVLYKKTDISTEYLSAEDLDKLEIGMEVTGGKELNQLLEDFE